MTTGALSYDPGQEENARQGWYLGNRDRFLAGLVCRRLKPRAGTPRGVILDAGCGTGGLAARLQAAGFTVTGVDADAPSLAWAQKQGRLADGRCADITALPFPDDAFDLCVSSEVIEHVADDVAAVRELLRVSRGPVILTVPAHRWLWTDSDQVLLHKRRYTRQDLRRCIQQAGGGVRILHPFGVMPALAILAYKAWCRLRKPRGISGDAEVLPLAARFRIPGWVDWFLSAFFRVELVMSAHGLIPWGHAWWCLVDKA